MIDYQRLFHTGVRVPDLDKAMVELGSSGGVRWAEPREGEQPVWTPEGGEQQVPLRFTYSVQGPLHLELLEGAPGSVWEAGAAPGVHHLGVWVDDVASETDLLLEAGWHLVAAQHAPDAGFGRFTYVAPPSGLIVELVDAVVEPMFRAWWNASIG